MTELTAIILIIVIGLAVIAAISFGRSLKIDTKHIKAELGRNGGSSAMDGLHARLTAQDEILEGIVAQVDDLGSAAAAIVERVDILEGHGPAAA